jgi:hypothetical protein
MSHGIELSTILTQAIDKGFAVNARVVEWIVALRGDVPGLRTDYSNEGDSRRIDLERAERTLAGLRNDVIHEPCNTKFIFTTRHGLDGGLNKT